MKKILFLIVCISFLTACKKSEDVPKIDSIAFSSCSSQWDNLSIFKTILSKKPNLYIALGDNIYADVEGLENLQVYPTFIELGYNVMKAKEPFRTFRNSIPTIATWDDHDYGQNNGGKHFPHKQKSKELFMDFWKTPASSQIRNRNGIYDVYYYGEGKYKVQIIILDTRWFLDVISTEPIVATTDTSKQILGEEEWIWLESVLNEPAALRIVASSTQFATEHNGYETWANYPHEMNRFYDIIKRTRAEGLFFISGDIHYAEINKRTIDGLYPIYDITSSGLTHFEDAPKPSKYRIGNAINDLNFGIIKIHWDKNPVTISQEIYNKAGQLVLSNLINSNELKF